MYTIKKEYQPETKEKTLIITNLNADVRDPPYFYADEKTEAVINTLKDLKTVTIAFVMKNFRIGYARASNLIDVLELLEIVMMTNNRKNIEVNTNKLKEVLESIR